MRGGGKKVTSLNIKGGGRHLAEGEKKGK